MEDKNDVVGHALLSDEHLLLAIDDEVAALVVLALTGLFHNRTLCHLVKMAELGADHDGYLSNANLGFVEQGRMFESHSIFIVRNLLYRHFAEDLRLVSESPDSCHMWEDRPV